jgi:thioredoxin-like negative regulator of GroEL
MRLGYQDYSVVPLMLFAASATLRGSSAFQPFLLVQSTMDSAVVRPPLPTLSLLASSAQSNTVSVEESTASETAAVSVNTSTPPKKKIIQTLESLPDFLNYIDRAPRNSLAVVEFYGVNCPICKRVSLKYKKIAKTYSSSSQYGGVVLFAEMEHPANKRIMDVLGIHKFPFLHVYRNGQCVAAHGTESSSTFEHIVTDTIQRELTMSEQDWDEFLAAFDRHIQQGTDKIDQLRQELASTTAQQQQQQQQQQQ